VYIFRAWRWRRVIPFSVFLYICCPQHIRPFCFFSAQMNCICFRNTASESSGRTCPEAKSVWKANHLNIFFWFTISPARSRVMYLFVRVSIVARSRNNFSFIHSELLLHKTVWKTACKFRAILLLLLEGNHWPNNISDNNLCWPWSWQLLGVHGFVSRLGRPFYVLFLTELTPGFIEFFLVVNYAKLLDRSSHYRKPSERPMQRAN